MNKCETQLCAQTGLKFEEEVSTPSETAEEEHPGPSYDIKKFLESIYLFLTQTETDCSLRTWGLLLL